MPGMSLAEYRAYMQLSIAVQQMGAKQQIRAGTVNGDFYQFNLSPTCPPSTSIRFRGGLVWYPSYAFYPGGFFIPSYVVDLTDSSKVSVRMNYSGYTYTFSNPYWYTPCVVVLSSYGLGTAQESWPSSIPDGAIYLYNTSVAPYLTEYETAAEAEVALREIVGDRAAYYGVVAGGLILRNNGNVTFENQYMAVDPINRGGSYLFGGKRHGWEMG